MAAGRKSDGKTHERQAGLLFKHVCSKVLSRLVAQRAFQQVVTDFCGVEPARLNWTHA